MYNRYIPESAQYTWVGAAEDTVPPSRSGPEKRTGPKGQRPGGRVPAPPGKEGLAALLTGKMGDGLSGILKGLKLEEIDPGDILLLLIVLYLLVEGDDLELVIALGLVLLMGLGGREEPEENSGPLRSWQEDA